MGSAPGDPRLLLDSRTTSRHATLVRVGHLSIGPTRTPQHRTDTDASASDRHGRLSIGPTRTPQHRTDTDASASDRHGRLSIGPTRTPQHRTDTDASNRRYLRPGHRWFDPDRTAHISDGLTHWTVTVHPEGITSGRTTSRSVASTRHHPAHLPNRRPHASESNRPNSSRHVLFVQSVRFERPTTVRVETVLICRFRGVHPVDESEK